MTARKSAQEFVRKRWQEHLPLVLDNSSGWHVCCSKTCDIQHLKANVCMHGQVPHVHDPHGACIAHNASCVVCVDTLYGCKKTGCVHECEAGQCVVVDGHCTVSNKPVMVQETPIVVSCAPTTNRRGRRRRTATHTNEQLACILMYDLLFSNRRKQYERQRADTCNDLSRRQMQRMSRECVRERVPFMAQNAVDICIRNRERYRMAPSYLHSKRICYNSVCKKYSSVGIRVWGAFSHIFSKRITFEAMYAALLYHMRRGIAFDGIYIIPRDTFLFDTLPGK